MQKRLYRSRKDQVIGGVCGGIAEHFGVDSVIVRLFAVLAVFFGGGGLLAYIIMWIVIPEEPRNSDYDDYENRDYKDGDYKETYKDYPVNKHNTQAVLGAGLIGLGVFLVVKRYIPWDISEYFWPALLIIGGIYILTRRKDEA